jgi:hypothetical protein
MRPPFSPGILGESGYPWHFAKAKCEQPLMPHSHRQTRGLNVPEDIPPPKEHVADVPTRFAFVRVTARAVLCQPH